MKFGFFILFLCAAVSASSLRQSDPLSIDLMRDGEDGEVHWALRCSKGINAETTVRCELRKMIGEIELSKITVPMKRAKAIVAAFLDNLPDRDLSDVGSTFSRVLGSPLHWRVTDGKLLSQGGFLTHGTPEQEKLVEETQRKVLVLEVELETLLIPNLR